MDRADDAAALDVVERFETYEDYLDSQLTSNDMGYLEDEEMARQLVELGYRGLGDTIRREVCVVYTSIWMLCCRANNVNHFRNLKQERSLYWRGRAKSILYQEN